MARNRLATRALAAARRVDRLRGRARIFLFRQRVRAVAAWHGGHVSLDLSQSAKIGRAIIIDVWNGTSSHLSIGDRTNLGDGVRLSFRGGSLEIGPDTDIRRFGNYHVGGAIRVGSGCVLSTGIHVHCADRIDVGDLTIIGEYSTIADSQHVRTAPDEPVHHSVATGPVVIGRNIWMGAHIVIASGVTVGDLAFVAAGAVVTKDVASGWLVGGVPAKPVRQVARNEP
ncbi:MAG TPA: acyltransferase [Mycobacteriales bacterium]|jgi:acetyltransferase-like isoleucine patch superfamily enzyme|nr:acyltransferase [Mycobacteriales bacterium]